jgi:hypothetical protein
MVSVGALVALAALAACAAASHSVKDHISLGPAGGNGVAEAFFNATSADGTRAFFDTDEQLVADDTDASFDMYENRGGAVTRLSTGSTGGNGAFDIFFSAISADGTRAFFETDEKLTAADTDAAFDVYERAGGVTTLISTGSSGGNGPQEVIFHAISSDGTRVFFETDEKLVAADTDSEPDVYERSAGTTSLVSTGPAGGNGQFFVAFGGVSSNGTRVVFETDEQLVAADSDAFYDVYERAGGTTTLVSTGPAGGNSNLDAGYREISPDGNHVFFQTSEQLVSADTDAQTDVYERSGGNTILVSTGPAGGNGALPAAFEGTSYDGGRVYFSTSESLDAADTDTSRDIYRRTYGGSAALLSTGPGGGNGAFDADFMAAEGTTLYFRTEESLVAADNDSGCPAGQGPQCRDVYESGGTANLVSTGPAGGNGAFDAAFAAADGARVFFDTREQMTGDDTDASVDVYERFGGSTTRVSTGPTGGNGAFTAFMFTNGLAGNGRVFFDTRESLMGSDTDASFDIYAADTLGHPRPAGASPARLSLVPAYAPCTAPNRTHGPPLAFGSCSPPAGTSSQATVGTPDALGGGANFSGWIRYSVVVGLPGPPADSDVRITSSLSDVRCRPAGASCGGANAAGPADYTGEVRATFALRMTDRWNTGAPAGGSPVATGQGTSFASSFPCAPTASTATGASCTLSTTANAIVPGLVLDGQRAIWQMDQVQVYDGGPDGDADTPAGDTLFAVQGIFVP